MFLVIFILKNCNYIFIIVYLLYHNENNPINCCSQNSTNVFQKKNKRKCITLSSTLLFSKIIPGIIVINSNKSIKKNNRSFEPDSLKTRLDRACVPNEFPTRQFTVSVRAVNEDGPSHDFHRPPSSLLRNHRPRTLLLPARSRNL